MAGAQWFTLRYGAIAGPLLRLLGCGGLRSGVAVGDGSVAVVMGWSFEGRAPRASVASALVLEETVSSRGVCGWRGDWIVSGSGAGLTEVVFEPPMKAHALAFPVRVRRLRVSVDDPAGLALALNGAAGAREERG